MALSKSKKADIVDLTDQLLSESKLTVMARYSGTPVKAMQALRAQAKDSGTLVRIIKNRLVKKALERNDTFRDLDKSFLTGQLLYAFNSNDDSAPAQVLANFAKSQPQVEFVGALTSDGQLMSAEEVKQLASLPNKDQLRAQIVGLIASPLSGTVGILNANVRGILNVLNARAEKLG